MANLPKISEDQKKLKHVLAEDRVRADDCLPCKLIGSSAFIGLGVYSYVSGQRQLQERKAVIERSTSIFKLRARQTGITGIATVLVGMGLWRLIN